MTAPERRRPWPALAFIGALSILTALVWFRVLHRTNTVAAPAHTPCPSATTTPPTPAPTVLPVPGKVSVLVLNSTQRAGIAGAASTVLKSLGFQVQPPADDSSSYGGHGMVPGVAEIRYGPTTYAAATLLSYYFPTATLKASGAATQTVLVSLGAKFKAVATAAEVKRALHSAHITLTPTPPVPSPAPSSTGC